VWVGGRRSAAIRRAACYGDDWMPYLCTPEQFGRSLSTVREAAAEFGRAGQIRGAVFCLGAIDPDDATARRDIAAISETYNQDFAPLADRYLVAGTPAEVTARLVQFADAGAEAIIFPGLREPSAWHSTAELLRDEVLPVLHKYGR
jgi:alkanesulfonate monooxygenase SsuD/methylene tetrahydromethanopterin reductase-like flavin-dependent oxidoreductase (luciferase family)